MSMIKGKSFKMKIHFLASPSAHALTCTKKKYSFSVLIYPKLIFKSAASNETTSAAKVNNKKMSACFRWHLFLTTTVGYFYYGGFSPKHFENKQ